MSDILRESEHKAQKDYSCDAYYWLEQGLDSDFKGKLSIPELRSIVKAKQSGGIIRKGQIYRKYIIIDNGFGMMRCLPEIDDICIRWSIYPDM